MRHFGAQDTVKVISFINMTVEGNGLSAAQLHTATSWLSGRTTAHTEIGTVSPGSFCP